MSYVLFFLSLSLAGFLAGRLFLLKGALRKSAAALREIQGDLSQNGIVPLPFPDRDLEDLLRAVNAALDGIRQERQSCARREREFQSQIEAVSHDLRTPLTVLLGYLKLLKKQADTVSQEREPDHLLFCEQEPHALLDMLIRKARTMDKLTEQLYDYSRLSTGDYEPPLETIDAGRILRETFLENCLLFEDAGLRVDADFAREGADLRPIYALGNKDALERIFTNLFQNAARYAHHTFRLSIRRDGGRILFLFENDTKVLSETDLPHLFTRFYMGDPSRSRGGSGLGLTIARYLAEKMGGSLDACFADCGSPKETGGGDCAVIQFCLRLNSAEAPPTAFS